MTPGTRVTGSTRRIQMLTGCRDMAGGPLSPNPSPDVRLPKDLIMLQSRIIDADGLFVGAAVRLDR
jgi:hypothetical protein